MEEVQGSRKKTRSKKSWRRHLEERISFSARLPGDVRGVFANSLCAVKYSTNPFADIRDSIKEVIDSAGGVRDWDDMEELVYCYIVLNPTELHDVIKDAFLSLLGNSQSMDHRNSG